MVNERLRHACRVGNMSICGHRVLEQRRCQPITGCCSPERPCDGICARAPSDKGPGNAAGSRPAPASGGAAEARAGSVVSVCCCSSRRRASTSAADGLAAPNAAAGSAMPKRRKLLAAWRCGRRREGAANAKRDQRQSQPQKARAQPPSLPVSACPPRTRMHWYAHLACAALGAAAQAIVGRGQRLRSSVRSQSPSRKRAPLPLWQIAGRQSS